MKPTIAELEAMLSNPNPGLIRVKMDGSLEVVPDLAAELAAQAALSAKLVADRDALALEVKEARELVEYLVQADAEDMMWMEGSRVDLAVNAFLSRSPGDWVERVKRMEEVCKLAQKHQDVYSNISKEEEYGGDKELEQKAADAYNALFDALKAVKGGE